MQARSGRANATPVPVVIHEPVHGGHRFTAVRVLVDALHDMDPERRHLGRVTLATSAAALRSEEFAMQLAPLADRLDTRVLSDATGEGVATRFGRTGIALASARARVRSLHEALAGERDAHLYVPYSDGLVQLLALRRALPGGGFDADVRAEALMMRTAFAYPGSAPLTRALSWHALRASPFDRLHLNDPLAWERLQARAPAWRDRVALMPDPIGATATVDPMSARAVFGLDAAHRVVGCIGQMDERKGVDLLIEAFLAARLGEHARLLLVGRQADAVRERIARANDARIVSIDRYATDGELASALAAMDLVATPYPDFTGSASVVLRAAAASRPVLGADTGWMGALVPRFGLGTVCAVRDARAFPLALGRSLDRAPAHRPTAAARAFVAYGGEANVRAHWTDLLRRRLGLAPHPALRTWASLATIAPPLS